MSWYSEVVKDLSKITDAISFFLAELELAKQEIKLAGSIEKAAADIPGIFEHRFSQLQEIEAILNFLNIRFKKLKSNYFKKYLENYQRSLSSRDVEKYVDGEDEVVDFEEIINEFALLRNKWLGLIKSLDQKSYSINNVIKLRCAGLDDATL